MISTDTPIAVASVYESDLIFLPQLLNTSNNDNTIYISYRRETPINLVIGNRDVYDKEFQLGYCENIELSRITNIVVPSQHQIVMPITIIDAQKPSMFYAFRDDQNQCKFVANSFPYNKKETREGFFKGWHEYSHLFTKIETQTIKEMHENLYPIFVAERSKELPQRTSTINARGANTIESSGFVYLLIHPIYNGWVKIGSTLDLQKRLSTYQTSDPQRRYQIHSYFAVDDRLAIEKWILYVLGKKYKISGEWVNCDISDAHADTQVAIEMLGNVLV